MHLVVIIPCLNEEKTVGDVVARVPRHIPGVDSMEIVVVDDGSTDATAARAAAGGAAVVSHGVNRGLGKAFHTGISEALKRKADIVVNIDGDGQFAPEDIPRLISPVLKSEADFATASRFKDPSFAPEMPRAKKWGNRQVSRIISLLTGKKFHDVSCGFRAYSREAVLNLTLFGRFTYTQETFLDLVFKGFRLVEVPLAVRGVREHGHSRIASNLPVYAARTLRIILFTFRDYRPFVFFLGIAAILLAAAVGLGGFFFAHYLHTGHFSPHLWAGMSSGFFFVLSIVFAVTGLLADMLDRIRSYHEESLYYEKLRHYYGEEAGSARKTSGTS
jgi:glycosyltransferase involved in cell wall biosynthesis